MSDIERPRPTLIDLHEKGSMNPVEVPDFNEVLGDRIEGMSHDARTFLKFQMLLRDQDFIGRMNDENSLIAMLREMINGEYLTEDVAVQGYQTAMETFADFKEAMIAEAEELGIPIPSADPSRPKNLQ